jgi:hypothetical protein
MLELNRSRFFVEEVSMILSDFYWLVTVTTSVVAIYFLWGRKLGQEQKSHASTVQTEHVHA